MTIPDETLMAFADRELEGAARAAIESAMLADPEVERRVARHRALRMRLQEAFGPELAEPVPERLIMAARKKSPPQLAAVTNLQDAREAAARRTSRAPEPSWWRVGSLAASLLVGFGLGYLTLQHGSGSLLHEAGGSVVADGALADALTRRLGADQAPESGVHVGLSFMAKSGEYCRTFSTSGTQSTSGLACRSGRGWEIQALSQSAGEPQSTGFRTAGSALAPWLLKLVEDQMSGEPLDQPGEAAAQRKNWSRHADN